MSDHTMDAPPPGPAPSSEARRALEAIVLVSSDPVSTQELAQILELSVDAVDALCGELAASYVAEGHGFRLVRVAGGWRYQTDPDLHAYVERYAMEGQSVRLSSAALETLAIVAYKQPVSRAQVSAIRGVNVDAVLRTLEQRGYVEEVGREAGVGQAILFGTTRFFLERLGIDSPDELPSLGDFVPAAEVVEALEQTLKLDATAEPSVESAAEPPGESPPPVDESAADRA
jgi:segregation and condensation protein B